MILNLGQINLVFCTLRSKIRMLAIPKWLKSLGRKISSKKDLDKIMDKKVLMSFNLKALSVSITIYQTAL